MASQAARQKAIKAAARMVRSGNPFLARAGDPPPPAKPIPGQEDIGRPSVRELFRNTVEVADVDPPNMEFRIVRQMVWQDRPDVIYVTNSKPIALQELKPITEYNAQAYGNHARVWLEQRTVSEWKESE